MMMKPSTYLIRFRRFLILGALVAGTAASSAVASAGRPSNAAAPDVMERFVSAHIYRAVNATTPDVVERFAIARPYGSVSAPTPDLVERFAIAHPYGSVSAPNPDLI